MITARSRHRLARTACVLVAAVAVGAAMPAAEARPHKGETTRVTEGPKGEQLDDGSRALGLSDDGRIALFTSSATNLLPDDGTPNTQDVYVRDLRNGHVERASVADDGSRLNALTADASISGDGRYVAFSTAATNVVPDQAKHELDVFVRDLWTGDTELVTTSNVATGDDETNRIAQQPTLSADGRYVAYSSNRTDLTPGTRPGRVNIFVTDRWTHTTRLVTDGIRGNTPADSSWNPTISADGDTVGFTSRAVSLGSQPVTAAAVEQVGPGPRFSPYYVWNADTGKITGASLDGTGRLRGAGGDARISPDGRYAVYSLPTDGAGKQRGVRMDVWVRELATGALTQVNTPLPGTTTTGGSYDAVMSTDDHWVYFDTDADNLVAGDTNHYRSVFRRDLRTGEIERVSVAADGSPSTGSSGGPYVDATGDNVVFTAQGANLVPGDTSTFTNVFLRRS
ncbi:TolB family protein [Kitasatospora sp. NPDC094028]